jgi:hypothetical protein
MESYFYRFTCLHFGSILPIPQQDRELRRFWFRNFRLATAQDERILNERRRHKDRPFDVSPVYSANLSDLDLDAQLGRRFR